MDIDVFDKKFTVDDAMVPVFKEALEYARQKEHNTTADLTMNRYKEKLSEMFNVDDPNIKSLKDIQIEIKQQMQKLEESINNNQQNSANSKGENTGNNDIMKLKEQLVQMQNDKKSELSKAQSEYKKDIVYSNILPFAVNLGLHKSEQSGFVDAVKKHFQLEEKNDGVVFIQNDLPVMDKENKLADAEFIALKMKDIYPHRYQQTVGGTGASGVGQPQVPSTGPLPPGISAFDRMAAAMK